MSPRLTNIILGVALLACGIYAYQWHSQLQSAQASLDTLNAERDRLNRRIAELKETKSSQAEPAFAPPETELPEAMGPGPGRRGFNPEENGGPPQEAFRGGDGRARFMAMMDNPEIQKLMTIQQKAALDARYAGLFKSLNLSPADLEKFKSLLVEKQASVLDARAAARAQGLNGPESRDALRQIISNAQAEVDKTIRSTLGEATFAQYQTYEQTQAERILVGQLQQRLSYSSSPLTDTQSNQVVALLAATNPKSATAKATTGTATNQRLGQGQFRNNGNVPITDAVVAGSQNILSSTQISALTQLQQEQKAQAELAAQLKAARQAAGTKKGNDPSPVAPTGKP